MPRTRVGVFAHAKTAASDIEREGVAWVFWSGRHFRPEVRINPIVRVRKKGALRRQRLVLELLLLARSSDPRMRCWNRYGVLSISPQRRCFANKAPGRYPVRGGGTWSPAARDERTTLPSGSAVSGPSLLRSYPSKARHHTLSSTIGNNPG